MDKAEILGSTESYVKSNIPKSRPKNTYLKHVLGVRRCALKLAETYKADKFIIEMAALLHDIGADAGKVHARESVKIGEKFLSGFDIPANVKGEILGCIENHSMGSEAQTLEQQVIQDADGITFIEENYKDYFEVKKQMLPLEEARKISIDKTKGMMKKIKTGEGVKLAGRCLRIALDYLESAS
jgi:putative nucleotidyltransferase with HDIG domain